MKTRAQSYPELAAHRTGRKFRQRPSDTIIKEFLQHVWNTGSPQTWRWITTTPHPEGEAPLILKDFSIPPRLRNGRATRAPCSICSDSAPKFDHGFLVFCSDGYLRIIGHECGHEFFGDAYAAALKEHEEENAEQAARLLLAERMPDLARTLVEAVTVARTLAVLLDFRERVFSAITLSAVNAMRRARVGDQLTIDLATEAADDKGRRIIQRTAVATVEGLDALFSRTGTLAELMEGIRSASGFWIVKRDELPEELNSMTRHHAFAAAKAVRVLDSALGRARATRDGLSHLLTEANLQALSAWGRHRECPKPFWIEVTSERQVFLGRGVKPRFWDRGPYLTLPSEEVYRPIEVS